ncbi:NAD(P)-dependent oxidoreductase [Lacticaseibacillus mingshuiensis]|uniref:NAD(P)-dependent oxidoreductase n=1 Tax=Lacticaseibacillus mingshuiensis TaxID=2799574 RepID=A0ABW4CEP3_9LACO|nr:NAD(P)-dependent oxidoreductase [Lacticaseibacillus mingshuiensis]
MFKIVAYGVRDNEVPYFKALNKYNYELKLVPEFLTHDNVETAKGADGVMLRANCVADAQNLAKFNEWGIKYVMTRTVGFNHIDLNAIKQYGMKCARVPAYSPYAVAELAMTLGMMLYRHTALATSNTNAGKFAVDPNTFSKEIHSSTVGIIGAGKIGATEASLYHGMGATVLAYDPYPSDYARQFVTFVEQDDLLAKSDIISIHTPYFKGQNDDFVNADLIAKMKDGVMLVNTARGELNDYKAVLAALKSGKLGGFATDVYKNETELLGHTFDGALAQADMEALRELYPKVLMTPHIGSYTEPALHDMIAVSYDNVEQAQQTGHTDNDIPLPKD